MVAFIFGGLGSLAYTVALRRVALSFLVAALAVLLGMLASLTLDRAMSQCVRSIAGVSIPYPWLLCRGAFVVGAAALAYVLFWVIAGYREAVRPNPSIERTSPGKPGAAAHLKR